jgi:carbamoyltransferase
MDGVGEWATTSVGVGEGNRIRLSHEIRFPHSLGLLYSAFTYYCGFKVNSGEYKLMGLAAYGRPAYEKEIREHVVHLHDDGSFRLDLSYFDFLAGRGMTTPRFDDLFGGPPRQAESPVLERYADIAASIQAVIEDAVLRLADVSVARSGCRDLVMAGGVALNCAANGALARSGSIDGLWVQPASSDAGGALGAALIGAHLGFGVDRPPRPLGSDGQRGSRLGPSYEANEIRAFLEWEGANFEHVPSSAARAERVAEALANGKIVAWFEGPMEFGPRALGGRSFLADPRRADMRERVNETVKRRESFRPFAPSVLADRAAEWFELDAPSPYMLRTVMARLDAPVAVPAVVHVDGTARVQTVDDLASPQLAELVRAFERRTGCPVLLNTSFNRRGEPIVATPLDAYRCFVDTSADLLVLDEFLLERAAQPARAHRDTGDAQRDLD